MYRHLVYRNLVYRPLGMCVLLFGLSALTFSSGCKRNANASASTSELVLNLPQSAAAPGCVSKLTVDDKDFTDATPATQKTVTVKPAAGKNVVTVVYSFWPDTHTNITRTRLVKLTSATIHADLTKEDPAQPDDVAHASELELRLPESFAAEGRKPRLTVDGKDFTSSRPGEKQTVSVKPAAGKDSVKVSYAFFTDAFTYTVRTKVVKVAPGKSAHADLTKADPAMPDKVQQVGLIALNLPETSDPPDYAPERITVLKINGQDMTDRAHPTKQTVAGAPDPGKKTVTVVYDYWPNTYTNIIRTKLVKVDPGKSVTADLNSEDPATPDKIKPIYFPTPYSVVQKMCEMAKITKDDVVYDIGCGDGRLVIMAVEKFGAKKGVGIDINRDLIKECKKNAEKAGVAAKTEFRNDDALNIRDLSEATVVLLYLGDDLNLKMRPILQKTLKSGSRIVSHRFLMGDWKPDLTQKINAKNNYDEDEDYVLHRWTIK